MKSSVFAAMGTEIRVITPGDHEASLHAVAQLFTETERCLGRFDEASELSRLNRASEPVVVSPLLFEALTRAARHVAATQGLFDPAVGSALLAAGYTRSFAPGALDRPAPAQAPGVRRRFAELRLDPARRLVARPPGLLLDLGGFVKGWTADRAARLLPSTSVIDAGGDAVLRGAGEDGAGWLIDVEDPFDPDAVLRTLRVTGRAVATSGVSRRRWITAGEEQHHLIDPRTGRPARSDLVQVTVVGESAEEAELLAKTALLLGAREGSRWLRARPGIAALLVRRDRGIETIGRLAAVHEREACA